MKRKLFGSSGVRGTVNDDLTTVLAARMGLAIVTFVRSKKILVARDTRVSSLMIENALVSGLLAGGAHVELLGVVPTPVLAYLTKKLNTDAGVMITASHNPPQYNGIKIFDNDGMAYGEKDQDEIERIIESERFRLADWRDIGEALHVEEAFLYCEVIQEKVKLHKSWHVVVDPGCGATFALAPMILENLGCKVTAMNAQGDGFFPARSPELNSDSLRPLAGIVRESTADVGVAYDGDGDRVAFIDEKGRIVDSDRVLAAYAAHVLKKEKSKVVVTNVEASMCVEKVVEACGGKVIRTRVGDVHVSEAIKKVGAAFGGEPCGAWVHPQFHYCPDGMLSSALLLESLEEEGKTLSGFISEVPKYAILRENIGCKNKAKHKIIENVEEKLETTFPKYKKLSTIDGVRLSLADGWVLVRASGTEPLIRLTVEGESLKVAKQIMEQSTRLVRKIIEGKQK